MSPPAAAKNAIDGIRLEEGGDSQEPLQPDLEMAQRFLDALDPGAEFIFQIIPEKGSSSTAPAYSLKGTLAHHADELTRVNNQKAGVFVTINASTGRTDDSVTRIRAYFVDKDGSPLQQFFDCDAPPNIINESSKGKYQGFWLTSSTDLSQFKERQQLFAQRFEGDPKVCNLGRVMRVPGFWHQKYNIPFQTRIIKLGKELMK